MVLVQDFVAIGALVIVWRSPAAGQTSVADRMQRMQPEPASSEKGCGLPEEWGGRWFQNGIDEVVIGAKAIDSKGRCVDRQEERFLFHLQTRGKDCWRCVRFFPRHRNVLQYKETSCQPEDSLEKICLKFNGDDPLMMLLRADAEPEPCPVVGPLKFNYTDYRGPCQTVLSTVDGCASSAQLNFRYQACPEAYNSDSRVEKVMCLGSWESGRKKFFLGRILKRPPGRQGKNFRCFLYDLSSSGGTIGVSADASCRELIDFNQASVRIKFESDSYPAPRCNFVSWLRHQPHSKHMKRRWETLGSDLVHSVGKNYWVVTNATTGQNISVATCMEVEPLGRVSKFVVFKKDGCSRGYRCVKAHKRTPQVTELEEGQLAPTVFQACSKEYFDQKQQQLETLLLEDSVEKPCPNHGRYNIQGCDEAEASVSFGCSYAHQLVLDVRCHRGEIETYNCHGHWTEKGAVHYLVVREQHTGRKACYVYTKHGEFLSISTFARHSCRHGVLPTINGHRVYNATASDLCNPVSAALSSGGRQSLVLWLWLILIFLLLLR